MLEICLQGPKIYNLAWPGCLCMMSSAAGKSPLGHLHSIYSAPEDAPVWEAGLFFLPYLLLSKPWVPCRTMSSITGPCHLQATKDCTEVANGQSEVFEHFTVLRVKRLGWTGERTDIHLYQPTQKMPAIKPDPLSYWRQELQDTYTKISPDLQTLLLSQISSTRSPLLPSLPTPTFSCPSSSTHFTTVFLDTMHELVMCWGRCSGFTTVALCWSFNEVSWLFPCTYPHPSVLHSYGRGTQRFSLCSGLHVAPGQEWGEGLLCSDELSP